MVLIVNEVYYFHDSIVHLVLLRESLGSGEKNFLGPPAIDGIVKNLYTEQERLTISYRVTWAWSEGVYLYSQQIMILLRNTFLHLSRPALGPTQPPVQWVPGLPGVESAWGVALTPHPLLVPRSKNRVELYLYSP
jgi:hypothetical protein